MISKILKIMRTEKGDSQSQLAKKLNIARSTLSGYETDYSNPTFELIEAIAKECDFEIIFRSNKTKKEYTTDNVNREDI